VGDHVQQQKVKDQQVTKQRVPALYLDPNLKKEREKGEKEKVRPEMKGKLQKGVKWHKGKQKRKKKGVK